ncbi:hypothetical protein MMC24_004352 [Lignoscripta atroalba]|nr:hypothetical protein [Lignoscripta atroalba]
MSAIPTALKWSSQLTITRGERSPHLVGDKITLPQSALEQLLAAATVTVSSDGPAQNYTSTFDPYNPYSYAAERQARSEVFERRQELPHPLTFRLVNPENGNVAYAGIREFSAEQNEVGLSAFLRQALGLEDPKDFGKGIPHLSQEPNVAADVENPKRLTVHAQQLPKGKYVRLRPLEAGYDPEDWKSLLERYLRDNFTTITNGEILTIPTGKEEFRFLVDKLAPDGDGICIIDTDLEVDIEALNEDQARETLKRRLEKSRRAPGTEEGSSPGGNTEVGKEEPGQVLAAEYVDYTLKDWDRSKSLEINIYSPDHESDIDLYVTPTGPQQRSRPREDEYVFGEFSSRATKRVRIRYTNAELEHAEALWVSVHGYQATDEMVNAGETQHRVPLHYKLQVLSIDSWSSGPDPDIQINEETQPSADETKCKNCHQWVPKRTMMLHENFCLRNNILCPHCQQVFIKSSSEWRTHWHCPHDSGYGNTPASKHKHDNLHHTPRACPSCNFQAQSTRDLAHHRTTTCPGKLILCQFCHLLVPQQGPSDPSFSDPEVILSGLTPHELADGARTTECHMCGKITRLRDMATHLKHHDLERLSRSTPRICRNVNCGRTLDGVGTNGEIKRPQPSRNDLGLCDTCYGPLYNSSWDPEGKALKRRVERKYLTQLLTGCGKDWCRNEYCRTGRRYLGLGKPGEAISSKEALGMAKPFLAGLGGGDGSSPFHLCTDEGSQKRRVLAEMLAAETGVGHGVGKGKGTGERGGDGYALEWCVAALEAEGGDLDRGRTWLRNWAPRRAEVGR